MKDKSALNGAAPAVMAAAGPTTSPSANILRKCLLADGLALVLMAAMAWIFTDLQGALSVVLAFLLVIIFFGLSLLAAHVFGRSRPQALISIFFMSYFVKVLGFAAVLFTVGTPNWLNKPWFLGSAVVAVLLWQGVEVWVFSKQRFLRFDDPAATSSTVVTDAEGNNDTRSA